MAWSHWGVEDQRKKLSTDCRHKDRASTWASRARDETPAHGILDTGAIGTLSFSSASLTGFDSRAAGLAGVEGGVSAIV